MTFWWKVGIAAAIGVAIATAVGLAYRHYSGLVEAKVELTAQVATLKEDVAREKSRADALERSVAAWDRAEKAQARSLKELDLVRQELGRAKRELLDVLSKHDLNALALAKPGLVESRVNAGSARALGLLQRATEAPAARGDETSASTDPAGP